MTTHSSTHVAGQPAAGSRPRDRRAEWFNSVARLRFFIETYRAFPRQVAVADDGWAVGRWVSKQRQRWSTLALEQREALCAVPGFSRPGFATHRELATRAEAMVAACLRAVAAEACLNEHATFDGYPVGAWLRGARRGWYRLTDRQLAQLRGVGIDPHARTTLADLRAAGIPREEWAAALRREREGSPCACPTRRR